ncbi:DUF2079 domain-containing protein [Thermococcus sp.]
MDIKIPKALILLFILYTTVFMSYSIIKCLSFGFQAYDTGIYVQSLWTTATGEGFFYNTPEAQGLGWEHPSPTHFGVHFQPILFFLVPIYRLFPYVETLLILETLALATAVFPLYFLSFQVLRDKQKSLVISILYLINPALHGINRYDFHPVAFAVPLSFLLMYYWEKENYRHASIIASLILLVKEDSGLILIAIGLLYILKDFAWNPRTFMKKHLKNLNLILLGILWITISLFIVIPYFSHHKYSYAFYSGKIYFPTLIGWLILINLMSFAFLPLLKPKLLLSTLPLWLELILSPMYGMVKIGYHYPYMLIPMLTLVSIYSLKDFHVKLKPLLGIGIISMILFSPVIDLGKIPAVTNASYTQLLENYFKNHEKYSCIMEEIKEYKAFKGKLVVQDHLFPYLANNRDIYLLRGMNIQDADLIIIYPGFHDVYTQHYYPLIANSTKIKLICSDIN